MCYNLKIFFMNDYFVSFYYYNRLITYAKIYFLAGERHFCWTFKVQEKFHFVWWIPVIINSWRIIFLTSWLQIFCCRTVALQKFGLTQIPVASVLHATTGTNYSLNQYIESLDNYYPYIILTKRSILNYVL